ncbi:hypothetical protein [Streptomyces sp. NPDC007984]|uniref:hypothetical protein n=1 Tax=Streptomyces sp. NPDC007984 TaxID=3364801 RepID=UPI0036EA4101
MSDPLDNIPAESLAVYCERIAEILQAEGEDRVNDLYPESGYGALWAELTALRGLSPADVERIDRMAERLADNRRKGLIR